MKPKASFDPSKHNLSPSYPSNILIEAAMKAYYENWNIFRYGEGVYYASHLSWDDAVSVLTDRFRCLKLADGYEEHDLYFFGIENDCMIFGVLNSYRDMNLTIYAPDKKRVDEVIAGLKEILPEKKKKPEDLTTIRVQLMSYNANTGRSQLQPKRFDSLNWPDIQNNYPPAIRESVENLIFLTPDQLSDSGRLILWVGPPGTGKTNGIYALAHHWRWWCSVHYVLDPEAFFGSSSYMIDGISRPITNFGEDDAAYEDSAFDEFWTSLNGRPKPKKVKKEDMWRLLVIEDSEQFLGKEAKAKAGQSMSRFLNLTDGFIGQGSKCLVLVTTNENVGELNEAVDRAGRNLARIEFKKFDLKEANDWLRDHKYTGEALDHRTDGYTLADLYEKLRSQPRFATKKEDTSFGVYA